MKAFKRLFLRVLFGAEIVVFAGLYVWGSQGISHVWQLEQENLQAEQANVELGAEITKLERTILTWNDHPFEKERIARTQLQMARPGDQIFYIS